MNRDYWGMAIIISFCVLTLFFVKKAQVKKAFFAVIVAQLFSWPISLAFVYFGLIHNPVRLFPHASDNNFLFAYFFHPTVFVLYYLHYPKQARLAKRILYTMVTSAFSIVIQALADKYTNLIEIQDNKILVFSWIMIMMISSISRRYIDWFFVKAFGTPRGVDDET